MKMRDPDIAELVAFLADGASRPRAVVIEGPAGTGKSFLAEHISRELEARGSCVEVVDDVDECDGDSVASGSLRASDGSRFIVVGRFIPDRVRSLLNRSFDRRFVRMSNLAPEAARAMLQEHGMQPWGMRSAEIIVNSGGNPRDLVDMLFSRVEIDWSTDATFHNIGRYPRLSRWTRAYFECDERVRHEMAEEEGDDAEWHVVKAELAGSCGDAERALEHSEQAIAKALAVGDTWLQYRAAVTSASCRAWLLNDPSGLQALHSIAASAERSGFGDIASLCWQRIFTTYFARGSLEFARTACLRGIECADRSRVLVNALLLRVMLGEERLASGHLDDAVSLLSEAVEIARERQVEAAFMFAAPTLARLLHDRGERAQARMLAEEALGRIVESGRSVEYANVAVTVARIRSACGDQAGALAVLTAPESVADSGPQGGQDFYLALEAVRVLATCGGDPLEMDPWIAALKAFPADSYGGSVEAAIHEAQAWRARVCGDRVLAASHAGRARQLWLDVGCSEEVTVMRPLLEDVGDVQVRPSLLTDAMPLGDVPDDTMQRQPSPLDALPEAGTLTKREREIALLVAAGMTNSEVAADLHLSIRTVEHHVANILRKLEMATRRDLVRHARTRHAG